MINIEGKQIRLRDWILNDLEAYQFWQLGEHAWKDWDGPYFQSTDSERIDHIKSLGEKIVHGDFSTPRTKLVIADRENDILVGTVNSYWISKETNWLASGVVIFDQKLWNKGIGKEALKLWIDYLFEVRPEIVRLDFQTWSGNKGMMALASKLGFKLEGQFRKARIVKNEYYDSIQFGILREEWASK